MRWGGAKILFRAPSIAAMPSTGNTPVASLPTGTVTFLFTDIEGSTALWDQRAEAMRDALARHDALLHQTIAAHRGSVVKTLGDGLVAVFDAASDALAACVEAQRALQRATARRDGDHASGVAIRVRMGLHTGEAESRNGDYFGTALNVAARVMTAAHGEQILVSLATAEVVRGQLPHGVTLREIGEFQLKGIGRPERLLQILAPDLRDEFPPSPGEIHHESAALPRSLTSFIGRRRELAELATLLARTRLLTLTAVGGSGKTRLALEFAHSQQSQFPGGVWFVDLAPVAAPERLPLAVADSLGVQESAGPTITEALCARLEHRRALIVLDNCEHLVAACADLVQAILARTGQAKVLATSRERLGVPGEQTMTVRPLDVAAPAGPGATETSDAVLLFAERAQLADPAFALTARTLPAVEDICRRLEGLPLAIELAAARAKVLPVGEIAARLQDRFRLLTGGAGFPSRHQTLRGVISWSFDQLEQHEKSGLCSLSVFAGGWTLGGAAAVAELADEFAAVDMLSRFVDKSLVIVEHEAHGEPRYRMLETVRAYALEQLTATGEGPAARDRHARHFVEVVSAIESSQTSPRTMCERLAHDFDNLMAANDWLAEQPLQAEAGLRLATALGDVLRERAHPRMGRAIVERALKRPGVPASGTASAHALALMGDFATDIGEWQDGTPYLRQALAAARDAGDLYWTLRATRKLGENIADGGDVELGKKYLEDAVVLGRAHGGHYEVSAALGGLGEIARIEGRVDDAARCYEEALAVSRELGYGMSNLLLNLAIVANEREDYLLAGRYVREAAAEITSQFPRSRFDEIWLPEHAAALAASVGDGSFAARMLGALDAACGESGHSLQVADVRFLMTRVERARSELGETAFAEARDAGRALSLEQAIGEMNAWIEHFLAGT